MRRIFAGIFSFIFSLSMLLSLSGCWQEELPDTAEDTPAPNIPQEDEPAPTPLPYRFSLPYEANRVLDPITCPDGMQQVVGSLIYESLYHLSPTLEPRPCLCDGYTCNANMTSYTFTIRPETLFSDGTELTAKDVRNSLERAKNSARYGTRFSNVSRMTYNNSERSITISLYEPNASFTSLLDIPICKGYVDAPLGTGPYAFMQDDSGTYLALNQVWWQRWDTNRPVERISLVESSESMLYRFTSREVQLIVADLTNAVSLSITGDIRYEDAATTTLQYVGCNIDKYPLRTPEFRHALSTGIDREHITSALLLSHAKPACFPVSPVSPLYPSDLETSFSLPNFTNAIAETGYEAGRTLIMIVNEENPFKVSIAQSIAQNFTAAGVPTETRVLPWENFISALSSGNFDFYYGEARLTADWNLSSLLLSSGMLNRSGWADDRTGELLSIFAEAEDRPAAMRELCAYIWEQSPILPVCFTNKSVLMFSNVIEGLTPTAAEPFFNIGECAIHLRDPES